jgi:cell division protein FtsQ
MTETSVVPELAAHAGPTFEELVAMDVRGRLAQSLKLERKRRATAAPRQRAHSWSASDSRALRFARRTFGALLNLNVPRGAGASAAALLLVASTFYGVIKGGHAPAIAEQIQDICDSAANSVGFRISEIALVGEHEVSREDILSLAGVTGRSSLLFLDAAQTRIRLLTNPWIAQAAVLKLYPGRLRIEIKERKAFALWQKDGRVSLIAADGTMLETYVPQRFASLPLVVGDGAEHAAQDILDLLRRYPAITKLVEASVLVAERRWNLHLKGGVEVLLPEREPAQALTILVDLDRDKKLLSRDIMAVDLRLPDRVTVQQSNAAAAARDAALKAAEKDKKAKRKETDA